MPKRVNFLPPLLLCLFVLLPLVLDMRTEEDEKRRLLSSLFPPCGDILSSVGGGGEGGEAIIQILFSLEGAPKMSGLVRSIRGMAGWLVGRLVSEAKKGSILSKKSQRIFGKLSIRYIV